MKFFLRKKVYAAAAAALTLVLVLLYANRYHIYRCLPACDGGELVLSGGVLVDRVAHQPFSGRARLKNGEQTLVLSYDEGQPDGLGVACQDGRIKEIVNWKKGRRDGKFMSFENGLRMYPELIGRTLKTENGYNMTKTGGSLSVAITEMMFPKALPAAITRTAGYISI